MRPPLRFLLRLLGAAAVLALGVVLVRAVFGWVFPVGSGSMEPLIATGEWVAVRYGREDLERYECVVFREEMGPGASVKLAAGLPGEEVRVDAAGDLRIDGRLRPDAPRRPAPVPVFDSALQAMTGAWGHGEGPYEPWERMTPEGPGEEWRLDASSVTRGGEAGLLRYLEQVDDGYLAPDGRRVHGRHTVHDVVVEFDAFLERPGGYVHVQLAEQGDLFSAYVNALPGQDVQHCYLSRRGLPGAPGAVPEEREPLVLRGLTVPTERWFHVRFANVDNRLRFEIDDEVLEYDYDAERNTPHWNSPDGSPLSPAPRVAVGGVGVAMRIRDVRVLRDFHVVPEGTFGVQGSTQLRGDEVFVLGFASGSSSDSRDRGPVRLERVIGRVRAVVWPFARRRGL